MRKRAFATAAAVVVVGAAGLVAGSYIGRQIDRSTPVEKPAVSAHLAPGKTIVRDTLQFPDGQPVELIDLIDGMESILVFLSPECEPCVDLGQDWTRIFSKAEAQVIAIAEETSELTQYLERSKITALVLVDPGRRLGSALGLSGLPTFVGVDEHGRIAFAEIGYSEDERERLVALVSGL